MRPSMPVLLISAMLAGVWAQASAPSAPRTDAGAGPIDDDVTKGLAARLAEAGAPPLADLAAVAEADGLWRVRGRTLRAAGPAAGLPAAFHALARSICDDGLARAACWRLEALSVAGVPADIGAPVAGDATDASAGALTEARLASASLAGAGQAHPGATHANPAPAGATAASRMDANPTPATRAEAVR